MASSSAAKAIASALDRLRVSQANAAPYEGQQVVKTVAARLRSKGSKAEAADLVADGAVIQLAAGEVRRERGGGKRVAGASAHRPPPTITALPPLLVDDVRE